MNAADSGQGVQYGTATMSSGLGHEGDPLNSTFTDDPELTLDWSYRALHNSIVIAKEIINATYAASANHTYFSSCSNGGRQGLLEAQMFPDDFDGIMVGSPPWWTTRESAWLLRTRTYNLPDNGTNHIPPSNFSMIHEEVMNQCDTQTDSLQDGIIMKPWNCQVDFDKLLCDQRPAESNSSCLSSDQVDTLSKIYRDYFQTYDNDAEGATFIYPNESEGLMIAWGTFCGYYGCHEEDVSSITHVLWLGVSTPRHHQFPSSSCTALSAVCRTRWASFLEYGSSRIVALVEGRAVHNVLSVPRLM